MVVTGTRKDVETDTRMIRVLEIFARISAILERKHAILKRKKEILARKGAN